MFQIEGPGGCGGHVGQEVVVLGDEPVGSGGGNELHARPWEAAAHACQRNELLVRGEVRGRGHTRAVTMGCRSRARESMAPAERASANPACMRASSSAVAARSEAAAPMMAAQGGVPGQEPDVHGRCALLDGGQVVGEGLPSEFSPASRASNGMASTRERRPTRNSAVDGPTGASEIPQLPATTVVTPCRGDGERVGSHRTCAS